VTTLAGWRALCAVAVAMWPSCGRDQRGTGPPAAKSPHALSSPSSPAAVPKELLASPRVPALPTSIFALVAEPAKYHGSPVLLLGYAHIAFEVSELCPHREDVEHRLSSNCVWLDVPDRPEFVAWSDHHMAVRGVFHSDPQRSRVWYAGSVDDVSLFEPWPPAQPEGQ